MAGTKVEIKFDFPLLFGKFNKSLDRFERVIAATVQTMVGLRFNAEGAHNGHPKWEPLKMRRGQILSLTGTLRKSISPPGAKGTAGPGGFVRSFGGAAQFDVEVGSQIIYASVHDQGAIIVPRDKKALRYVNPMTGKYIFSKRSIIPKRSFTDINAVDEAELSVTLANTVAAVLEEAEVL